jgi:hypothetical protein
MNGLEIFVVGSLWFWLLLAAETLLLFVLVEWDRGALATATFVATLLLLQFLGDVNLYGYAIGHPWTVVLGAAAYFTVGTLWAIAKWWFYVHQQRGWYDELRSAYLGLYRVGSRDAMPADLQDQWQGCLVNARRGRRPIEVRPLAARHKAEIVRWMSYWPWSLSWTLVKDPIRRAFLTIYREIAAHLQRISDRAFEGVEADLPPAAELPIAQRTDPVLAKFGIDVGSLHVENTAGHHAAAWALVDPAVDPIVGGEKTRPDRVVHNDGVRRAIAQGTEAGTGRR